jgi:hypothetical protein
LAIANVPILIGFRIGYKRSGEPHSNIVGKSLNADALNFSANERLYQQVQCSMGVAFFNLCLPGPYQYAV